MVSAHPPSRLKCVIISSIAERCVSNCASCSPARSELFTSTSASGRYCATVSSASWSRVLWDREVDKTRNDL